MRRALEPGESGTVTRFGRAGWGPHAERVRSAASTWKQPLTWDRKAAREGTRPFVFCSHLSDVFDNQAPVEWRRDLFDLIRARALDGAIHDARPEISPRDGPTRISMTNKPSGDPPT